MNFLFSYAKVMTINLLTYLEYDQPKCKSIIPYYDDNLHDRQADDHTFTSSWGEYASGKYPL